MAYQVNKNLMKMILYMVFISFVALVLIFGSSFYFMQDYHVEELENSLVVSRLLYSENCLASSDNFGEINLDNFYEEYIIKCSGLNEGFKQGVRLRLFDKNNSLIREVEINKELTTQCLIGNVKNIEDKYECTFSKHYVFYEGKRGILEILVANENL